MSKFKDFKDFVKTITDKAEKHIPNLFRKNKASILKSPNKSLKNAIIEMERTQRKIEKCTGSITEQILQLEEQLKMLKGNKAAILKSKGLDARLEKATSDLNEVVMILDEKKVQVELAQNRIVTLTVSKKGAIRTDYKYQDILVQLIEELGTEAEEATKRILQNKDNMTHTFIKPSFKIEEGFGDWILSLVDSFNEFVKNLKFYIPKWSTNFSNKIKDVNYAIDNLAKEME